MKAGNQGEGRPFLQLLSRKRASPSSCPPSELATEPAEPGEPGTRPWPRCPISWDVVTAPPRPEPEPGGSQTREATVPTPRARKRAIPTKTQLDELRSLMHEMRDESEPQPRGAAARGAPLSPEDLIR